MIRTIAPVNAALVQAVPTSAADSFVTRDSNGDSAFQNVTADAALGGPALGTGLYLNTVSKTGAYTATEQDFCILCNATGGAFTITLPAAASHTDKVLSIKKTDASANAITIDGNAAETIDGAATISLPAQYDSALLICDGSNWHLLAASV